MTEILQNDDRFAGPIGEPLHSLRIADVVETQALNPAIADKIRAKVADELVDLVHRQVTAIEISVRGGAALTQVQRFGHARQILTPDGMVYALQTGQTISSNNAKRQHRAGYEHLRRFGANEAAIVADNGRLILSRSGRSDTGDKLKAKLVRTCIESMLAAGRSTDQPVSGTGIDRFGESYEDIRVALAGDNHFYPVIVSAMDAGLWVSRGQRTRRALGAGGEDERAYYEDIGDAIETVFGANEVITVQASVNGEVHLLAIHRPPLLNITLSTFSKSPETIEMHRQNNQDAAAVLFERLAYALHQRQGQNPEDTAARDMGGRMLRAHAAGDVALTQFFSDVTELQDSLVGTLGIKDRMALDYLCLNLPQYNHAKRDSRGEARLGAADPGIEVMMLCYLLQLTNMAACVECKSGVDRTLTMVAFFTALDRFERLQDRAFRPGASTEDDDRFRVMFSRAAIEFGAPVVKQVRGAAGRVKWDEGFLGHKVPHWVPQHWFIAGERNPLGVHW